MGSHRTLAKMTFFEEALRVPLILRLPQAIPAGRQTRAAASGTDVAPTILDYCGLPPLPQFHGKSLRDAIDGRDSAEQYAYCEHSAWRCLRSTDWKYVAPRSDGPEMLFDLRSDPYEMHNLLGETTAAERAAAARSQLAEQLAQIITRLSRAP